MANSSQSSKSVIRPRNYQTELFERAKERNIVIVLATGSGKTLIAVLLIQHFSHQLGQRPERNSSALSNQRTSPNSKATALTAAAIVSNTPRKWTVFLAPTIHLVQQQSKVIAQHTGLTVATFVGTRSTIIDGDSWNAQAYGAHVVVSTPEIFLQALTHGFIFISDVNLLIMDECHHVISTGSDSSHPYAQIMRHHYHRLRKEQNSTPTLPLPHVLGSLLYYFVFFYFLGLHMHSLFKKWR